MKLSNRSTHEKLEEAFREIIHGEGQRAEWELIEVQHRDMGSFAWPADRRNQSHDIF